MRVLMGTRNLRIAKSQHETYGMVWARASGISRFSKKIRLYCRKLESIVFLNIAYLGSLLNVG